MNDICLIARFKTWFVGKSLMVKSERYGKPHLHKPRYTSYTDIVPFPFQRRTRFVNASGTNEIEAKLVVPTFVKGRYHNTLNWLVMMDKPGQTERQTQRGTEKENYRLD